MMRAAILCLILTLAVASIGLVGVGDPAGALLQVAFFGLLVLFVVLMVRHLVEDR